MDLICVWPHSSVRGWTGALTEHGEPLGLDRKTVSTHPLVGALEAFGSSYETEAGAVGYKIPGEDSAQPRLLQSAVPGLQVLGKEPEMHWVFIDIDRADHAQAKGRWASWDEARAAIEPIVDGLIARAPEIGQAMGWYASRSGWRAVWRLRRPILVTHYGAWAAEFLEHFSKLTGIPIAEGSAGGIDHRSKEWWRVFYLPKIQKPGQTEPMSPPMDLVPVLVDDATLDWRPKKALKRDVYYPDIGDVVVAEAPPMPPDVPMDVLSKLANGGVEEVDKIRRGIPLAAAGSRDSVMVKTIVQVLEALDSTDPEDAWNVLAKSVAADASDGAPPLEKLWNRAKYWAAKRSSKQSAAERAAEQPPIVQYGTSYYVWADVVGGYLPTVASSALAGTVSRYASSYGLQVRDEKGKIRASSDLFEEYGALAQKVVVELGRAKTIYDAENRMIVEAACAQRDIAPQRHPDVERYFELLGASDLERFLDWLACLPRLNRPTAALYLRSRGGVGKGMFVAGLAQIWGANAMAYKAVGGDFNEGLAKSPLIHVDEGVPPGDSGFFDTFRSLTAESFHTLTRKFQPPAELKGCPRFVITANNDDALKVRRDMVADDLAAIGERIFYVQADPAAADYLKGLGGRDYTDDWIITTDGLPGKIAEHVMWLHTTRTVKHGSRFLVAGVPRGFHRDLAMRTGKVMSIAAAVSRWFVRVRDGSPMVRGIVVEPDAVLVNVQALRDMWTNLTKSLQVPPDEDVIRGLAAISLGAEKVMTAEGEMWVHRVPMDLVERAMQVAQTGVVK